MFKNTNLWTIATAIMTVLVYIDGLFITGNFMFTIPLAVLGAIIAIIASILEKKYIYIFVNIILAIIACISFIVLW